jgi:hypothetical protein
VAGRSEVHSRTLRSRSGHADDDDDDDSSKETNAKLCSVTANDRKGAAPARHELTADFFGGSAPSAIDKRFCRLRKVRVDAE